MVRNQRLLYLKLWKCHLELQNKDFIVNHVTVILLLNLILSTLIVLFLIKQNLILDKAQEYRSQNLSLSHA